MNNSIGIFDSGVGGLTVASAIARQFPNESIIYVGDTAHFPYGEKSAESIRSYSLGIADFLMDLGCKMVVIACNSASSAAYSTLKSHLPHCPVVDVISPLVDSIAKEPFNKVGVIATKATIRSGVYESQLKAQRPDLDVFSLATPLFAPMIEEGFFGNEVSQAVIRRYLSQPELADADALLLACTHYPLIRNEIEQFFGSRIKVFDSVDSVVQRVEHLLTKYDLFADPSNQPSHRFFVSDYTTWFEQMTEIFYRQKVKLEPAKWQKEYELVG